MHRPGFQGLFIWDIWDSDPKVLILENMYIYIHIEPIRSQPMAACRHLLSKKRFQCRYIDSVYIHICIYTYIYIPWTEYIYICYIYPLAN